MQPRSGVKHPELEKRLPGGIWAIFVVLFSEALCRAFSSSDALSIPAASRVASRWYYAPACLPDK